MKNMYCFKVCKKGKEMAAHFLDINNSVYDAVIDFELFEKECRKSCRDWQKEGSGIEMMNEENVT